MKVTWRAQHHPCSRKRDNDGASFRRRGGSAALSEPGARDAVPGVEDAIAGRRRPSHLKFENLQFTVCSRSAARSISFASLLESGATVPGVIVASAGNHAQGVAHHAQRLGLRAVDRDAATTWSAAFARRVSKPGVLRSHAASTLNSGGGMGGMGGSRGRPWPRDGICHHHVVVLAADRCCKVWCPD